MPSTAIRLFDDRAEQINLILPVVFLLLVLVTGYGSLTSVQLNWSTWLASTVGMNTLHNTFSFSFFAFPEFRKWLNAQNRRAGKNLLIGWGIIIFLIMIYFQFEPYIVDWPWPTMDRNFSVIFAIAKILLIVRMGAATFHAMSQHSGLSLVYNKKYLNSGVADDAARIRVQKVERIERALLRVYCHGVALATGVIVVWNFKPGPLRNGLVLLALALAAVIVGLSFWYPGRAFRRKRFFLLRLFLAPLAIVTQMGLVGYYCVHGIESLFFFRHISNQSQLSNRRNFLCLTYGLCLAMLVLTVVRPGPSGLQKMLFLADPSLAAFRWIFIVGAFSTAISFVHYYLEGRFYHFSDPVTREHFGPLVFGRAKSK